MNTSLPSLSDYLHWLNAIKQRVQSARLRMALAANRELIRFYWELRAQIEENEQDLQQWGSEIKSSHGTHGKDLLKSVKAKQRVVDEGWPPTTI